MPEADACAQSECSGKPDPGPVKSALQGMESHLQPQSYCGSLQSPG